MALVATNPSLRGVHITKTYGDGAKRRTALDNVSLDLFSGQLALLMGPSGSGKSTLLAVASGLLEPDSGQVLAEDNGELRDVWAMTSKQREDFRQNRHSPGQHFTALARQDCDRQLHHIRAVSDAFGQQQQQLGLDTGGPGSQFRHRFTNSPDRAAAT